MKRIGGLYFIFIIGILLCGCGKKSADENANEVAASDSQELVQESVQESVQEPVMESAVESEAYNSEVATVESDLIDSDVAVAESDEDEAVNSVDDSLVASADDSINSVIVEKPKKSSGTGGKGTRDNTPKVLVPAAAGVTVKGNAYVTIDVSNANEGYMVVTYLGSSPKVKLQVTGSDGITYTYNVNNSAAVIPLTSGTGNYTIGCYENISGTSYATVYSEAVALSINNTFGPFLYPNQYVNFNAQSAVVAKAKEIVASANSDIDAVKLVYDFVISNVKYDYDKANTVKSGYLPVVDSTLSTKKGICFDYAALMSSMLRSQGIPTKLVIGYADDAYHAWISVYIKDVGWVNNVIYFDGKNWTLMDPTFAANTDDQGDLKKYIGEGGHYTTMYVY